jgi:DNA-binding transcriptional LysR family regulator
MEYRYLKAFLLTARHLSFSKAASELRIAQSAVSRQIKLLEDSLKEQLIVRSSKQVILTQKGHELYLAATDFDKMSQSLFNEEMGSELRIGLLHGLLESWSVPVIKKHYAQHKSNLIVRVDEAALLVEGLTNRSYDILITNNFIENELVSSLKLLDEELVIISKKKFDLDQIEKQIWITYDANDWLYRVFKRKKPRRSIQVNSMTAIVNMVRNDMGVAIVPTHLLGSDDKLVRYPVPSGKNPSIYLSTLNYTRTPKHVREFIEILKFYSSNLRSRQA